MRTYYFAADTQEIMLQWMHCMSLASVLQDRPTSYEDPRVITHQPTNAQHSPGDESDAGFGTCRPSFHHHLYANAPPKPRRLANEDMGSSSEQSPEHHQNLGAQPQQPPRLMQSNYQFNPAAMPQVQSRLVMSPNNAERRTPDTYSRPAGSMQATLNNKVKPTDYEDIYNSERRQMENQSWTNKFGQQAYLQTGGQSATIITKGYEATYNSRPEEKQQLTLLGQSPRKQPPRPHSADFLDYDARRHEDGMDITKSPEPQVRGSRSQLNSQPPRPKSSLDIMRDPDNLYWSEEGYAQKMRQSAYLLQQGPGGALPNPQAPSRSNFPSFSNMLQSQSSSRVAELAANRVLSPSAELLRESEQQHILNMQRRQQQLLEEQKVLQQQLEYQKQQSQQEQLQRQQIEEEEERQLLSYYSEMQSPMTQQPFMRSASARLPRQKYDSERDDEEEGFKQRRNSGSGSGLYSHRRSGAEYGSQKFQQYSAVSTTPDLSTPSSLEATTPREESMKRLLEWKQRMLQSPLARKPSGSATRGVNSAQNQLSNYYKQQALRELADQERRAQGLSRHLSQDALHDGPYSSKLMDMQALVDDQAGSVPWSTEMLDSQEAADFLAQKSQEDSGKMSRSRSQDGRRSSASNRYTSYSSDEDIGDARESRKRSRRPSQSNRSRRSSTEEKISRKAVSFESPTGGEEARNNFQHGNSQLADTDTSRDISQRGYNEWNNTVERLSNMETSSRSMESHRGLYEDRYFSGKCSDSGYDTLQNGVGFNTGTDTLHRSHLRLKPQGLEQQLSPQKHSSSCNSETKLDETAIVKEFSFQYVKNKTQNNPNLLEGTKSLSRNLVSNRKKMFEDQLCPSGGSQGSLEYLNEIPEHQIRSRSILINFVFGDDSFKELRNQLWRNQSTPNLSKIY
ncbi:formin-J-like isoform X2 [Frankliniella occidentalis]|uniref:Formin-J-like isoform X2 n=1 Tax=Frankliniella occidentalis TaxID=133901 RepID=A0A9C6X9A9_FRAOC|nr:formin-J-like isoform X2 [Frankliniella occidentalis]